MMKDYYKINEISKLYNIGIDSLRYYERLGILTPRRDTNGYRLYSLKDIYKLNTLRDMRKLGFSMKQIKDYLDFQSLDNTLDVLKQGLLFIEDELKKLKTTKEIIQKRIESFKVSKDIQVGVFKLKKIEKRLCARLVTEITRDEEMDLLIKRIHKKYEENIFDFGNQPIGATISMDDINKGFRNVYQSVFFVLDDDTDSYDFVIPPGLFVSYYYRGDYQQNLDRIKEVIHYAKSNGYELLSEPFEMFEIDNRDTIKKDEFLTEIQIMVKKSE